MSKNKPRWKDLPFEERTAKRLVQKGLKPESAEKWKERYKKEHKEETKNDDVTLKIDILQMCDNISTFFQELKAEIEKIPAEKTAELTLSFLDYFENHADAIGQFSIVVTKIRKEQDYLLMLEEFNKARKEE